MYHDDCGHPRVNPPSMDLNEAKIQIRVLKRKLAAMTIDRDRWRILAVRLAEDDGGCDEESL